MANHCENVLRISGKHSEIVRFDEMFRAGKEDMDYNYHFDNLYPTPELSICETADWRKAHWGVKGNFYEDSFAHDTIGANDLETYYYFDTPWVGPEALIEYVSATFPELLFMLVYSEDGNDVGGICTYSNGSITSEELLSNDDRKYWFGEDEHQSA